jgi:type IV pilus assembly protein PilP
MKKRSKFIIAGMAAWTLGIFFPGMGISAPPAPQKAVQVVPQAPLPSIESPLIFKYDPSGKPDPFKPFVDLEMALKKQKAEELLKLQKQKAKAKQETSIYPLQRFALDQFKLVGIAGNNINRAAMVQDPAGKYYPLFIQSVIGLNGAKVIEIRESSVILEEMREVASGKSKKKHLEKKHIVMKLHKEGEEGKP